MADWFEQTGAELGIDPQWAAGGFTGGNPPPYLSTPGVRIGDAQPVAQAGGSQLPQPPPQSAAPEAGQWAPTNQGFLDWATAKKVGEQQGSFIKIPPAQLPALLQRYTQETGNQANFQGGPSGDRVDFGQGTQDALTSSGQIWNNESTGAGGPGGSRPAPSAGGGGPYAMSSGGGTPGYGPGGGGAPTGPMPTAPGVKDLDAPAPFTSTAPQLGTFQGPAAAAAPGQVSYQNATAPGPLTAQQVGAPERLSYTPGATPTAFAGSRQGAPATLSYQNLATPANYAHQDFTATTAADMEADPGYQFRLKAGQEALENSAAARGMVRGGNQAKALIDYSSGTASQEFANVDARRRATNTSNNAGQLGAYQTNAQTGLSYNQNANSNAFNFGNANLSNAERANSDNYGRASSEAQQGFANANTVQQQNNAGAMNAAAGNNAAQLGTTQANNQANLAFGAQNFNAGFQVNQANNAGQANATTTNNAANQAAQAQLYGQASNTYNTNAAAQNQTYQQQLGTYTTNTGNALAYNQNTNTANLNAYTAQSNNALGFGNLALGYQNSGNQFQLGQMSNGIQQGTLDLNRQGQAYDQDYRTFDQNYRVNTVDPWNRDYQLAQLGQPTRPD
jgi:hypothetical protein